MKKCEFSVGDIVFARVRGYPYWPARITSKKAKKYKVFFYGTYEESGYLKANDVVPYTQEHKQEFSNKYIKQCGYAEGLEEIENNPDIAFGIYDNGAINEKSSESVSENSPTITVERSPEKVITLVQMDETDIPAGSRSEKREANVSDGFDSQIAKRNVSEEIVQGDKYSRSGRKIKPNTKWDNEKELNVQRTIWATDKQTGDLVELPVDNDKPAQFESETKKLEWEMEAARKALMLKKQIEDGVRIPYLKVEDKGNKKVKIPDSNVTAKIEEKSNRKINEETTEIPDSTVTAKIEEKSNRKIKIPDSNATAKMEDKGNRNEETTEITDSTVTAKIEEKSNRKIKIPDSNATVQMEDKGNRNEETTEIPDSKVTAKIEETSNRKIKIPDSNATAKMEDKGNRNEETIESETIEDNFAYLRKRKIMLKSLRVEKKLEDLHASIKKALHRINPQPMRCLELLEEFLEIPLNSLALKKHSHVVNLIKRLRKYDGPEGMSPQDDVSEFVPLIKQKCEEIYEKIKMTFNYVEKDLDDDQGFHEEFTSQVLEFEEETKHMEEMEIVELITDPTDEIQLS